MENILHYVPDPENLLALEPEELAGYILEYLNALSYQERTRWLNRNNFASPFYYPQDCPPKYQRLTLEQREEIIDALMEAWFWLEHENILAPKPDANTIPSPKCATLTGVLVTRRVDRGPRASCQVERS